VFNAYFSSISAISCFKIVRNKTYLSIEQSDYVNCISAISWREKNCIINLDTYKTPRNKTYLSVKQSDNAN